MKVNKISPASGTAITLGDSGDTFTIPSGATITNNGTQNGFGSTSASDLSSGTLPMARLSGTLPALNGSALTALNATQLTSGTIPIARITYLHTVQTHVTATSSQSISANTVTNITNLNATITPSTGTKILVTVRWNGEGSNSEQYESIFGLKRGSTIIGSPAAAGSRSIGISMVALNHQSDNTSTPCSCFYQYLDSPSTGSAITYYATIRHKTAQTIYNNRTVYDNDNVAYERITSTITLQEVVAP